MANKNTNMILAVAVIAVCAIAIIGVGYAYTATTDNTSNDSTLKYITLDQGTNTADYADKFSKEITYDTVTEPNTAGDKVVTTYKLTPGQTKTILTDKAVVELGTISITAKKTNTTDGFIFYATDNTGATESPGVMGGTFYMGISIDGDTDTESIMEYKPNKVNYYKENANGGTSLVKDDATTIGGNSSNNVAITVKMYCTVEEEVADLGTGPTKPLNGVTFTFTADVPPVTP